MMYASVVRQSLRKARQEGNWRACPDLHVSGHTWEPADPVGNKINLQAL